MTKYTGVQSGSQRRAINRKGNIYTLAQAAMSKADNETDLAPWLRHNNSRVRLLALAYSMKLSDKKTVSDCTTSKEVKSPFDLLVERFAREGKKDPVKSARASLAASARKSQKDTQQLETQSVST